jgi:hypothetical protein
VPARDHKKNIKKAAEDSVPRVKRLPCDRLAHRLTILSTVADARNEQHDFDRKTGIGCVEQSRWSVLVHLRNHALRLRILRPNLLMQLFW